MAFRRRLFSTISNLISNDQFSLHVVQILGTERLFEYMSLNSTVSIGYEIEITSNTNEGWYINILNTAVYDGTFADGLIVPGGARQIVEGYFYLGPISFIDPSPNPSPQPSPYPTPNPRPYPNPYPYPRPSPYPSPSAYPSPSYNGYEGDDVPHGSNGNGHESQNDMRGNRSKMWSNRATTSMQHFLV